MSPRDRIIRETRQRQGDLNELPREQRISAVRRQLTALYGATWSRAELERDFTLQQTIGCWVYVRRRCDGRRACLTSFQDGELYADFRLT